MSTMDRIRALNDAARRHLTDGRVYFTRGIAALPVDDQATILARVRAFDQCGRARQCGCGGVGGRR